MARPKALDLFCGAGGAAMGLYRAGFDVVGIDIKKQPRYPFPFIQADALKPPVRLGDFDLIWASPPCQAYSQSCLGTGRDYPDLVPATREMLKAAGPEWVIENVPGAPLRGDFILCGCRFGLELRRRRIFETSWRHFDFAQPCSHYGPVPSVVGHGTPSWVRARLGYNPTIHHYRASMGIDWMNRGELSQAIPPAYSEHIGHYAMMALELT